MSFIAKRCSLSASQLLVASSGKVFPLLCPTREYEWITKLENAIWFFRNRG